MRAALLIVVLVAGFAGQSAPGYSQSVPGAVQSTPTFRSGVSMVTVSAVVRDSKGRLVPSLTRDQFQVLDRGEVRPIKDFRPDNAAVSVALLFDASGSMSVSSKVEAAKRAAGDIMAWLQVGRDEFALFAFDTRLEQLEPFSSKQNSLEDSLNRVEPFGMTSL